VYYLHDWRHPDEELWAQYRRLEREFPGGVVAIAVEDPEAEWAVSSKRAQEQASAG
jgi:hypothetical protein